MDDGGRPAPLPLVGQAAVDQRLAEADQARERSLQLVRHVGEELTLDLARALHGFRHSVESSPKLADLVASTDADAAGVVPGRDVLGRTRELRERPREGLADQQDEEHRDDQRGAAGLEQPPRELARGRSHLQRLRLGEHYIGRVERVARRGDLVGGGDVSLAAERCPRLADVDVRHTSRIRDRDRRDEHLCAAAVPHDLVLCVEEQQAIAAQRGDDKRAQTVLELHRRVELAVRCARLGDEGRSHEAFLVLHLVGHRHNSSVQLFLNVLDHQLAHQEPRQGTGEKQADRDDAGSGRQEAQAEGQLVPSSRRYPTPQTVSMLGSVTLAAASFSLTCCTWTSTVRV